MSKLYLTERALQDLEDIYQYSLEEWDEHTAARYINVFEDSFNLLKANNKLLRINRKISNRFKVYPVNKHILICDIINDDIYVLTVRHTSMDLLERLHKLEPTLDMEAGILFKKISN